MINARCGRHRFLRDGGDLLGDGGDLLVDGGDLLGHGGDLHNHHHQNLTPEMMEAILDGERTDRLSRSFLSPEYFRQSRW